MRIHGVDIVDLVSVPDTEVRLMRAYQGLLKDNAQ